MALTRDDNPYVPGFGVVPPALAGREPEFADLEAALRRVRRGIYEQPRLLSGDRGMGKTAVLAELTAGARADGVWVVEVEASRTGDLQVPLLRELHRTLTAHDLDARLGEQVRRTLGVLRAFSVAHVGVELAIEADPAATGRTGDLATDLGDVLDAVGRTARAAGTALLLTVDEVQLTPGEQLGPLFAALQHVAKGEVEPGVRLPILTVVAGLTNARAAMRAASATYVERVREHELGLLSDAAATEALTVPADEHGVVFSRDALTEVLDAAGGYPYFVQLVGYEVWNAAADRGDHEVISPEAAHAGVAAAERAADAVFRSRLDEVPDTERRYLDAVVAVPADDRRSGRIAEELGGTAGEWGWARQRLIERGLLRPDGHGRVAIALPGLERHLVRSRAD